MTRWRWRGSVALLAVAVGFVVYPLVEGENDVINSDWPAFATGGRLIVENPSHLYDLDVQRRGTKEPGTSQPIRLGLRWIVESTNSWWSNYGQLRRNTDRRPRHRHAALCLATTVLIVGKLIDHRDRWNPQ